VVAGLSLFLSHFLSHVNINIAAFFSSFRLLCTATSIYFPEKKNTKEFSKTLIIMK
jgi:hypothetical protein